MNQPKQLSGVFAPVITPFDADLRPDAARLIRHCRWLLSQNCQLAVFGTNSEANSLSTDEKIELLDALVEAGIDPARMMPGTGACALTDTVRLTAQAVKRGCAGALMLPPFYYKAVSDDGLFRSYAEVIERVGDACLRIYLYHIPPIAQVPISHDLIERLIAAYPDTVVGIKDSSGDWANTEGMLKRFPGFTVFAGSESFLLRTMRGGGAGCISATANINPAAIHKVFAEWQSPGAEDLQAGLDALRGVMQSFPMIPALKETLAQFAGDPDWRRLRPPLDELTEDQRRALTAALSARNFAMPGLPVLQEA